MVLSSDRFTGINKPTLCCVLQNLLSILDFFERGREWSIVVVSYLKYLLLPEIFLSVSPDMKSALHSLLNKQICIAKTMVGTLCAVTILIFLISSCCNKSTCYPSEQRQKVDSIVKTAHSIKELDKLLDLVADKDLDIVFVTNELGMGLVGDTNLSRYFLEIGGKVNMYIADRSQVMYFVVSGQPIRVK